MSLCVGEAARCCIVVVWLDFANSGTVARIWRATHDYGWPDLTRLSPSSDRTRGTSPRVTWICCAPPLTSSWPRPAVHVFSASHKQKDVDACEERGHDGMWAMPAI